MAAVGGKNAAPTRFPLAPRPASGDTERMEMIGTHKISLGRPEAAGKNRPATGRFRAAPNRVADLPEEQPVRLTIVQATGS